QARGRLERDGTSGRVLGGGSRPALHGGTKSGVERDFPASERRSASRVLSLSASRRFRREISREIWRSEDFTRRIRPTRAAMACNSPGSGGEPPMEQAG